MLDCYTNEFDDDSIPIILIVADDFESWLSSQEDSIQNFIDQVGLLPKAGQYAISSDSSGYLTGIFAVQADVDDAWVLGKLASVLPTANYHIETELSPQQAYLAAMAWGLGSYQFQLYRDRKIFTPCLYVDNDFEYISELVATTYWLRDMINTPNQDFGPEQLAAAAITLAETYGADYQVLIGDELLEQGYPAIHAVGRGSDREPRLIDLRWGNETHPKVTLVGKGVCFDTGGLNLKPSASMRWMKKDMGGAAHVLALARLIMYAELPICLRVLIPAVENSVSGCAYLPGDIITTRGGITVEIDNTDAEGRMILADALYEAASEGPELLIDMATLTGAARIAVGADLSAFFTDNDVLATNLAQIANDELDPVCRLPLYKPYMRLLESKFADVCNSPTKREGGAIVAALFLQQFVGETLNWVHFDINAWNDWSSPGKPEGGEAQGLRVLFRYLEREFS